MQNHDNMRSFFSEKITKKSSPEEKSLKKKRFIHDYYIEIHTFDAFPDKLSKKKSSTMLATQPQSSDANFSKALSLYQGGRISEASDICQQSLEMDPQHSPSLSLLGIIAYQANELGKAELLLNKASFQDPRNIYTRCNLGLVLHAQGKPEVAIATFEKAVTMAPDFAEGWYNLGISLHSIGEFTKAKESFQKALSLNEHYSDAYINLGITYKDLKKYDKAIKAYSKAVELAPDNASAWYNLGMAFHFLKQKNNAKAAYCKAITLHPNYQEAIYNYAVLLYEEKNWVEAEQLLRQAVSLNPKDQKALNNLGYSLENLGRIEEAMIIYNNLLAIKDDFQEHHKAYCNIGNILTKQYKFDAALEAYENSISLHPSYANAYYNIGTCFMKQNLLEEAITHFRKAVTLDPEMAEAYWNLSHCLLLRGEFIEGWELYKWRWQREETPKYHLPKPEWNGQPLPDKTLLVYTEQGQGDSFMFVRYLPQLKALVSKVVLACEQPLFDILQGCPGTDEVILKNEKSLLSAKYDFQVPLLNLPTIFKTTIESIPAKVPYLNVSEKLAETSQHLFSASQDSLKIGIVWQGNPAHGNDKNRSCQLKDFSPLFKNSAVQFFSLQKDGKIASAYSSQLINLSDHLKSYAATAAIMEHLDLIITVDTSVGHLAGALGKPCWVLIPFQPDWRWLLEKTDSPWYPTMKLYRQNRREDWRHVFEKIEHDLNELIKNNRQPADTDSIAHDLQSGPEETQEDSAQKTKTIPLLDNYQLALKLYSEQQFAQAAAILEGILQAIPSHEKSLRLLANIYYFSSKLTQAEETLRSALHFRPNDVDLHSMLGCVLEANGKSEQAMSTLQKALLIDGNCASVHYNLGNSLYSLKNFNAAIHSYQNAIKIKSDYVNAYFNLGNSFREIQHFEKAIQTYKEALSWSPQRADILLNLGIAFQSVDKCDDAVEAYRNAIEIDPGCLTALHNLGLILQEEGNVTEAEKLFRQALTLDATNFDVLCALGILLQNQERYEEAINSFLQANKSDPTKATPHIQHGNILIEYEKFGDAILQYQQALSLEPHSAEAFYNLGIAYKKLNKIEPAISAYRKAIDLNPEMIEAYWNLSLALLTIGSFQEGWKFYSWRWKLEENTLPLLSGKEWQGESDQKATLLIFTEQGRGDSIQFVRFLPLLKNKVGRILFACEQELVTLFASLPTPDKVFDKSDIFNIPDSYDYYAPLLDLPRILNLCEETIPSVIPYIAPCPQKSEKHAALFEPFKDKLKIGIAWQGSPRFKNNHLRSCEISHFRKLLTIPGCKFFSLQYGADIEGEESADIINLSSEIQSFTDTAALMSHLDLIITVDTATAHLAGALGKPTWVLLSFSPDWRWQLERTDSPWYPTMKLFRKSERHNWEQVFDLAFQMLVQTQKTYGSQLSFPARIEPSGMKHLPATERIPSKQETLYLGLSTGNNFGWGVCGDSLTRELSKKMSVQAIQEESAPSITHPVNGSFFQTLINVELYGKLENVRGQRNYGYTFFENELNEVSTKNAQKYDLVFAGSSWCQERLIENGINNCEVLIQGIDTTSFYPITTCKEEGYFVIFSGGKFEFRKGQDLVLAAIKILQQKYPDIYLVNCWQNMWQETMRFFQLSRYINYHYKEGMWQETMNHIYEINGLDPNRIMTLPFVPSTQQREIFKKTDIGVFPNRCEGGTNLVLMEYMACGKPVIASNTSGHKDIITERNSLQLNQLENLTVVDDSGSVVARWQEPSLDELIAQIEYAYHQRDVIKNLGRQAGEDLKRFTWERSAQKIINSIYN